MRTVTNSACDCVLLGQLLARPLVQPDCERDCCGAAYFLVERRLHLTNREERQLELLDAQETRRATAEREREQRLQDALEAEQARKWEVAQSVLSSVADEFGHNQEQAMLFIAQIPHGELPDHAFYMNGWDLIVQAPVVTAIQERTLRRLVRVYDRFRSANECYATTIEVLFGPAAPSNEVITSSVADGDPRSKHKQQFRERKDRMMDRLLDGITELQPHLSEALQDFGAAYDEMRGLERYVKSKHFPEIRAWFDGRCCYCGLELSASQAVQDHLIPLNQSGLGLHAWGNVVPSCATCNAIKLGRPWRDVVEERGGKAVIRRRKRIEDFVEHHRYAPPFDLREATADLYAEVGNVAMALIRTKIDRIRASST